MFNHILVKFLLLVSLAFNQGISAFVSAHAMQSMQSFANTETLAICTGKTMRWIAADVYFDTGQIVEVAAPSKAPSNLHEVDCVFAQFTDAPKTSLVSSGLLAFESAAAERVEAAPVLFISTLLPYQKRARAPPYILV